MTFQIEIYDSKLRMILGGAVRSGLEIVGEREVEAIQYDISINCPAYHAEEDLGNAPGRHPGAVAAEAKQHSPVGGPPYLETGALRASIDHLVVDVNGWPALDIVSGGEDAPYAEDLEYGTEHMGARPFMAPAAARLEEYVVETIGQEVDRRVA